MRVSPRMRLVSGGGWSSLADHPPDNEQPTNAGTTDRFSAPVSRHAMTNDRPHISHAHTHTDAHVLHPPGETLAKHLVRSRRVNKEEKTAVLLDVLLPFPQLYSTHRFSIFRWPLLVYPPSQPSPTRRFTRCFTSRLNTYLLQ